MKPMLCSLFLLLTAIMGIARCDEPKKPSSDETAIRDGVTAYTKEFNAGDSKALASR
jgi:hypothetical protein